MRKIVVLLSAFCIFSFVSSAQITDSAKKISISAYAEVYYANGINGPKGSNDFPYIYNFSRENEFALNLGMIKCSYADSNIRGTLSLMTGTYSEYNLAAEPGVLKNVYEATVGCRIYKNLWIDAGVFPSHIGAEVAIGKDNINLTRSLIAENSPYYETGIKLSLDNGKKWAFNLLLLNGWQIMRETNGDKAVGTLITFKPLKTLTINSCSFAGNEKADSAKQYRIFHDLNFNFSPNNKFSLVGGFDVGVEQKPKADTTAGDWNLWHGASLQAKITLSKKVCLGLRLEEFWDKYEVVVPQITLHPFETLGASANIDVKPYRHVLWRTEYRYMNSKEDVFLKTGGLYTHVNHYLVTSLSLSF